MSAAADRDPGTDWATIFLWILIPVTVAAGFVASALTQDWESAEWLNGLLVLIPLEFLRALVFSLLSETYRDYQGPGEAVRFFLLSLVAMVIVVTLLCLYVAGFRDFIAWIRKPEIYHAVALALAVIVADGVISVYFFRGDAKRMAARLQAAADDARDWLLLAGFQLPVVLALTYGALLLVRETQHILLWLPNPGTDAMRSFCLLYAAFYFLGKATFLAHANSLSFNRTGRRLFGADWIQLLIWKKYDDRAMESRSERATERKRREVLMGESEPSGEVPER